VLAPLLVPQRAAILTKLAMFFSLFPFRTAADQTACESWTSGLGSQAQLRATETTGARTRRTPTRGTTKRLCGECAKPRPGGRVLGWSPHVENWSFSGKTVAEATQNFYCLYMPATIRFLAGQGKNNFERYLGGFDGR
jgi:hypothetical protein